MGTDEFLEHVYQASLQGPTMRDCPLPQLENLREKKRAALHRVLALDKLSQMAIPFELTTQTTTQHGTYSISKGIARYLPQLTADFYKLEPSHYRGTVVFLHGHGNGCGECLNPQNAEDYHHNLPLHLAEAGYRVYMPELIGFGDAVCKEYRSENSKEQGCYANTGWLLLAGIPLVGVRVYQILCLLEHLKQMEQAPPALVGISGGGTVTMYTAALTQLLKGAGICCYANTFRSSILSMRHCIDNYIPSILDVGEEPELISLAAPTPLFLSCGEYDQIYPIQAAREAEAYVRAVYSREGAEQKITAAYFAGKHEIEPHAILQWLKYLFESEICS